MGLTQETPAPISDIQSNSEKISTASALEIGKKIAQTPVNNLLNVNTEAKLSRATKKSSEIEYNNISNGVDLKYELLSEEIKESIVLNKKQDNAVFSFTLHHNNLTLKENKKDYIFLDKEGKFVFKMKKLFMFDANMSYSDEIETTMVKRNGSTVMTIIPSEEWLNDSSRKYPVVIDPIISTSNSACSISGKMVNSGEPNVNYSSSLIYLMESGMYTVRGYYKLNTLPTLSKHDVITNATVSVNMSESTSNLIVSLDEIDSSFDLSTISWDNKPSALDEIDYVKITQAQPASIQTFNVTSLAKRWVTGEAANGFVLSKAGGGSTADAVYPSSSASIEITYVNTTGLEDYMTYQTAQAGR